MLIKLVEVKNASNTAKFSQETQTHTLVEVFINPEHVVCLREVDSLKSKTLTESLARSGLDSRQRFTKINLQRGSVGIDMTVVGDASSIASKLGLSGRGAKSVLNG